VGQIVFSARHADPASNFFVTTAYFAVRERKLRQFVVV
jgi:hypothetical protein